MGSTPSRRHRTNKILSLPIPPKNSRKDGGKDD